MAVVYPERIHPNERASPQDAVEADRRGTAMRHLSRYSVARYLAEALFLARGLLLARILGPAAFGLWSQMKITLLFLQFGKLGASEAMLREVPYAVGRGDEKRTERIRGAVFAFDLLVSGLIGLGIVAGLLVVQGWPGDLRGSWALLAAVFVASQMYWFAQVRLRTERRFGQVGRVLIGFALLSNVLGVPAAWYFGLHGFLVAFVLSYALVLLPAIGGTCMLSRPRWDSSMLREMLSIGFPIMAAGALLMLLWNADKLAVWILLPRESLGIYALGSYVLIPAMLVPEALSVVLYPRLMERFGRTANKAELARYLTRPTLALSYLGCPALGLFLLTVHLPIHWLLPRYAPAVVPAQILIAALYFMVVSRMPQVLLVSLNRQRLLLTLTAVSVVVAALVAISSILSGAGLIGAAAGAAAGYVAYSMLSMAAALRTLRLPLRKAVRFVGVTVLPYAVIAAAVAVSIVLLPVRADALGADLASTGIRCLVVLLPGGLLIGAANRRLGLLRRES